MVFYLFTASMESRGEESSVFNYLSLESPETEELMPISTQHFTRN